MNTVASRIAGLFTIPFLLIAMACVGEVSTTDDNDSGATMGGGNEMGNTGDTGNESGTSMGGGVDTGGANGGETPIEAKYPVGPYGYVAGDIVKNLSFTAFVDDDGDGFSFNDSPRTLELQDYFRGFNNDARLIVINVSAGWCGPCKQEAGHMREWNNEYYPQGVRIMTALFEDSSGKPASVDDANDWAQTYQLPTPVLADTDFNMQPYFDENATPMNMFIDANTMEILDTVYGGQISAHMDYYLENMK